MGPDPFRPSRRIHDKLADSVCTTCPQPLALHTRLKNIPPPGSGERGDQVATWRRSNSSRVGGSVFLFAASPAGNSFGFGCLCDQRGDGAGFRGIDRMAGSGFHNRCASPPGHHPLRGQRNHAIVGDSQLTSRLCRHSGSVTTPASASTPGNLCVRHEGRDPRVDISREGFRESHLVEEQETARRKRIGDAGDQDPAVMEGRGADAWNDVALRPCPVRRSRFHSPHAAGSGVAGAGCASTDLPSLGVPERLAKFGLVDLVDA